jgi:hypothetical protein
MVLPIWFSFATSTHENISILKEGMKFFLGDYFNQLIIAKSLMKKVVGQKRLLLLKCF